MSPSDRMRLMSKKLLGARWISTVATMSSSTVRVRSSYCPVICPPGAGSPPVPGDRAGRGSDGCGPIAGARRPGAGYGTGMATDEDAIRDLVGLHAQLTDDGEYEERVKLYTEDGELIMLGKS